MKLFEKKKQILNTFPSHLGSLHINCQEVDRKVD